MSSSGSPEMTPANELSPGEVGEYLRQHPDFLEHHPDVLAALTIPHGSGDAVSLLERQARVLRSENGRLRTQLDGLIDHARRNESLNGRIHALALTLMNAVGPRAIFERLEHCLRDDFGADHVGARIFAEPAFVDGDEVPQFVGADGAGSASFAAVIDGGETVCGLLDEAQQGALFGAGSGMSAVMMPLAGKNWRGLLVIASDDPERYQAGMGTEFLTYLKDVVALVVDPWVKEARKKS
ncbi:MAG: DUF484 family protein [Gammaproteobacteria bacterium]